VARRFSRWRDACARDFSSAPIFRTSGRPFSRSLSMECERSVGRGLGATRSSVTKSASEALILPGSDGVHGHSRVTIAGTAAACAIKTNPRSSASFLAALPGLIGLLRAVWTNTASHAGRHVHAGYFVRIVRERSRV